jgi:UPF0271 protein
MGEGFGRYTIVDDEGLLDVITSANVACGFHAGDPRTMAATVDAAVRKGVSVGAHPGFPDLVGFGRRKIDMTMSEISTDLLYQLGALSGFLRRHDLTVQHITPHGSLGNCAATDAAYAEAILEAVDAFDPDMTIVTYEGELAKLARERGFRVALMFLADRSYGEDLNPISRKLSGAVINDDKKVAERVVRAVTEGVVEAVTGADVPVRVDTVLLHGDTLGAVQIGLKIREALIRANVLIEPMAVVLRR